MGKPTTYTFEVMIDLHEGARRVAPHRIAKAIHRAITAAQDADIAGTEILDSRFGQVTVKESRPTSNRVRR